MPFGFFSIQAYITEDKILMGIYSPEQLGTPAAFNPLAYALMVLGIVALLLTPVALLGLRKWWGTKVRPWLLTIGVFSLIILSDSLFYFMPTTENIQSESLWLEFWAFFGILVFSLLAGYGIEFLLSKRKRTANPKDEQAI
jgi:hypothetical protein